MSEQAFNPEVFLKTVPHKPGVYRMLDKGESIIYVGKAKDLKKRVSSYFRANIANSRTWSMVQKIEQVALTITETEAEALLLESNLIKEHKPRYNVLLRDDKSYPYIYVSSKQEYPRVSFHRGARSKQGEYFGPYPSAGAVRETLALLQKLFKVRQCEDSYFSHRKRPCLQYQIKRCHGPCTEMSGKEDYARSVSHTIKFLKGKSDRVISELVSDMDQLSQSLRFEEAADVRDQIEKLRLISQQQYITKGDGNIDVMAFQSASGVTSVHVITVRNGHTLGSKNYFPRIPEGEMNQQTIASNFIAQYYLARSIPGEVVVDIIPDDIDVLQEMLALNSDNAVKISRDVRGRKAKWLEMSVRNALHALKVQIASKAGIQARLYALQDELNLSYIPVRMECFDISHTQGEATVASCVVFGVEGPIKADYRRYNISGIEPGDDYAAMKQVLERRFKKVQEGEGKVPDILVIDGGKGQVKQAIEVLESLQVTQVDIVGVVKGEGRKAEFDNLIVDNKKIILDPHSPAMHLLQQIRDESHRFAISGHRQKRQKKRTQSVLEEIQGLGPKRRQELLKQFGGIRAISRASVAELTKVNGISKALAIKIYDYFR